MNIFLIDFISMLMLSGFMCIKYKNRSTFQKVHVLLTEKVRRGGRP